MGQRKRELIAKKAAGEKRNRDVKPTNIVRFSEPILPPRTIRASIGAGFAAAMFHLMRGKKS